MTQNPNDEGMGAGEVFSFFNEIGIIHQLSSTLLARTLPDGVHPSHFGIINHLYRLGDGRTPVRIAQAMQVTKNTMTHSLKVLSERGFISIEPNPEDARGKLVFLTPAGRKFREESIQKVSDRFGHLFESKHIASMQRAMDDLVEIRKHLDKNR